MSNSATMEKTENKLSLQSEEEFVKTQGVTQTVYAKMRGISKQAISKHIKNSKITLLPNGRIDPEAADAELEEKLDPAFVKNEEGGSQSGFTNGNGRGSYLKEKYRKEKVQRELLELTKKERLKELVNARQIQTAQFKKARAVRDKMLNVSDRISAKIAAESDEFKCNEIISSEIAKALVGV